MITFVAYLLLQASILTGNTSTNDKSGVSSTSAPSKTVCNNGGWVDKD